MTTLAQYVSSADRDAGFVADCEERALAMVEQRLGGRTIPAVVKELATLEVGADLFYRRSARNGVASFDGPEMQAPVRIARDPMRAADEILRPYLGPGIA